MRLLVVDSWCFDFEADRSLDAEELRRLSAQLELIGLYSLLGDCDLPVARAVKGKKWMTDDELFLLRFPVIREHTCFHSGTSLIWQSAETGSPVYPVVFKSNNISFLPFFLKHQRLE